MSKVLITESNLENIADAIRAKNGGVTTYTPAQMSDAIDELPDANEFYDLILSLFFHSNQSRNVSITCDMRLIRDAYRAHNLSDVSVPYRLCRNNQDITTVIIPTSVRFSYADAAFAGCTSLTDITFIDDGGTALASISTGAFGNCTALTSVTLPNTVTSIASGAFSNCSTLATVDLPASLLTIADAFGSCAITSMICRATTPPTLSAGDFGANAFAATYTIYVPSGTLATYEAATGWSNHAGHFSELSS